MAMAKAIPRPRSFNSRAHYLTHAIMPNTQVQLLLLKVGELGEPPKPALGQKDPSEASAASGGSRSKEAKDLLVALVRLLSGITTIRTWSR
jgi:hypothetical protein